MSLFLSKTRDINKDKETTQVGVNGGALPCVRFRLLRDKRTSLISPTLRANAKQLVLDRTRVSGSRRYSKATRSTSLGEVAAQT